MVSVLAFLAVLGVCGLMLWGSYKIEPHWVSKDARRVVCYGQGISNRGEPYGRWRELRLTQVGNGILEVRPSHGTLARDRHGTLDSDRRAGGARIAGTTGMAGRILTERAPRVTYWRVNGASPDPPPRRIVYLLDGNDDPAAPELLAIRLPLKSRAIPMLEALAANKSKLVNELLSAGQEPERNRGTKQSEAQPDRD